MKQIIKYGLLAGVEAVYGTPPAMAGATHGVDLLTPPKVEVKYMHDGQRAGKSPASTGGRQRVGRMGRYGEVPEGAIKIEPAGADQPYVGNILPNVHTMMRLAGFTATLDTTVNAAKVTYAPAAVGADISGALEVYVRGQKYALEGFMANLKLQLDAPGIPTFDFTGMGTMAGLPLDAAVPAITYPSIEPAKAEAVQLQIGSWEVGNLKSVTLEVNRNLVARLLNNQTGKHGGFVIGVERLFKLTAIVEAANMPVAAPFHTATEYQPFQLMEAGTVHALGFKVGTVQYNRWNFAAPTAQLVEATEQEEGSVSTWSLGFELKPSTLVASDECEITFD